MKINKLSIIISIFILIILIILLSYICFKFTRNNNFITNSLIIVEDKTSTKMDSSNNGPIDDGDINTITPYKFSVRNAGTKATNYELLIEDIIEKDTKYKLLSREYLNYELYLNNQFIKRDSLSNIKNNIIDSRKIGKDEIYNYSLRIWITGSATDSNWMNKYYNYKLLVSPI